MPSSICMKIKALIHSCISYLYSPTPSPTSGSTEHCNNTSSGKQCSFNLHFCRYACDQHVLTTPRYAHSLATTLSSSQRQCKISCPTPPQFVYLRMKKQQLQYTTHVSDFSYLVLRSMLPPVKETAKHVYLTIISSCLFLLQPKPVRTSDELRSSVHQEPPVCATPRSDMSSVLKDIGSVKLRSVAK